LRHVVVIGGGFAGVSCARNLAANPDVRVTLIDRNNYHQFQPLLYQVATAELGVSDVAFMLRKLLDRHANVDVKMVEATSIDPVTCTVRTAEGETYQGDFLVLAAGSQPNFFGTPGADKYAFPLYSLQQAEVLRSRILAVFESADRDPALIQKGALNFVIVGSGPTGTEMAGALTDMLHGALPPEYQDLAIKQAKIYLVDHGHAVLAAFSKESQTYAATQLQERGVQLLLGVGVSEVGPGHVSLSDGRKILTHTTIWAGGLKAAGLSDNVGLPRGNGGRIEVQPDFSVKGFPGVYALGDFADILDFDGTAFPQLASVAQQCGKWCAANIAADIAGQPRQPFRYFDKGIMAMIGRNAAVAEVGKKRHELEGVIGFAAWLGVHAALLDTNRARLEAFFEWAWTYFGRTRGAQVLDRTNAARIDWDGDGDGPPTPTAPA
jgi:NADH dehydrogenase